MLKSGPEQQQVVGPLVARLVASGWSLDQIRFGRREWVVPKTPSQASLRGKGRRFKGNPVDIAVFDSVKHADNPKHLAFMVECKQPDDESGKLQLEIYLAGEPHAKLGIWANHPTESAPCIFLP